jgi:spermidine synthase
MRHNSFGVLSSASIGGLLASRFFARHREMNHFKPDRWVFETCPNRIHWIQSWDMNQFARRVLFFLFFLSGFSSLVYQVVWTRMAFASFGIITPVLSVVLSVFMLGLAIGSWAGGRWIPVLTRKSGLSAVFFYAIAELLIGLGAFTVPKLFLAGEQFLLSSGETDSFHYLLFSALVLTASILPWCMCMGATFPFMMAFIRERDHQNSGSFSFLYLPNVLGAMSGTFLAAVVWIELCGFNHTLWIAAAGNFSIAIISVCLGWREQKSTKLNPKMDAPVATVTSARVSTINGKMIKWILFSTGFMAMAMEVVWTRAFTPVLKTQVYSFAMIVFTYLGATFAGSWMYRRDLQKNCLNSTRMLIAALAVTAFLPVLVNDSRFVVADWSSFVDTFSVIILLASICPVCALLGYLTPSLIDEYAAGEPNKAGHAYAINVMGCILGPLVSCYILLPHLSERHALILLGLPFIIFSLVLGRAAPHRIWGTLAIVVLAASIFLVRDFEGTLIRSNKGTVVRRDYAASVISLEHNGVKSLLVNGIGMTILTPITKFMVHLPLAFHKGHPESTLVICFGMGTTYRSALSWNIDTTVVELVPGVTKAFEFYHADAPAFINDPNGQIIIDDGRRYLSRTDKKFDVIVVDPPPPVQAAGSSLLFSREFYELAKKHLKQGGILQMWFPGDDDPETGQAVLRSIHESFPYVRCFRSVEGWGAHMLASMEPIKSLDAQQLAARMPENAKKDLVEWNDSKNAAAYLERVVTREISISTALNPDAKIQVTDDEPFNEYFLFRRLFHSKNN